MGSVKIVWKGTVIEKISLVSPTKRKRQLILLAPFGSVETGTLMIRVTSSGAPVQIDGIGVELEGSTAPLSAYHR